MKKALFILIYSLLAITTIAQINVGTNFQITGQLPIDKRTVVTDTQARNAINSLYRYEGLLVYVTSEQKNYQLKGGLLNANWAALTSAADTNLWVSSGANIYNKNISGKVGIGSTAVPDSTLTVTGSIHATKNINVTGVGIGKGNNSGTNTIAIGFYPLLANTGSGNIGIGYSPLRSNLDGSYNIALGQNSSRSNTTGSENVSIGNQSSYYNTSGSYNVALGSFVLHRNTLGNSNVAIGYYTMRSNTTASNLVAIGDSALYCNTTGKYNTAIGSKALYGVDSYGSGQYNTAIGYNALKVNRGLQNTAVGNLSLSKNSTGIDNTAMGNEALLNNTSGNYNTASGTSALNRNTTGFSNVAVGASALYSNTTASNLVAVGDSALYNNITSGGNTAVGSKALYGVAGVGSGISNTAVGYNALKVNRGSLNVAVGSSALVAMTTGGSNVGVGMETMKGILTGNNNVAVGHNSMYVATSTSEGNTSVGTRSGYPVGLGNNTTHNSTYVGLETRSGSLTNTTRNEIVIGAYAKGKGRYTATIGSDTTTTDTYLYGALHIDSIPSESSPDSILTVENGLVKKNSVALGAFAYLPSSDTTGIGTADVYYRIKGAFTTSPMSKFTVVATPAIRYDGGDTRYFEVHWCATVSSNHNGCTIKCGIKKGGSLVTSSVMATLAKTANELYNIAGVCVVQLSTNDEIQLVVTADTNGDIITFHNYTTSIRLFY